MGKDLKKNAITAGIAIVVLTVLFGLVYPLVTTGVSQLLFPDKADGSKVEVDGKVVGSSLIGQPFKRDAARGPGLERDPAYFQPRPSVTGYSPNVTFFNNLGPNSEVLSRFFANKAEAYVAREGRYTPGLDRRRRAGRRRHHLGIGRRPAHLRGERAESRRTGSRTSAGCRSTRSST